MRCGWRRGWGRRARSIRAFIGIPVPEAAVPALHDVQMTLEVGRLVVPENWHVTLAFLDDQPEPVLEDLHEALCDITQPGFGMRIAGVDVFGGGKPRLLFAGADATPPLTALRKQVRSLVRGAGIDLGRERFRPHVTLARFRGGMTAPEMQRIARVLEGWGDREFGVLPVDRFVLYQSTLGPGGAWYEALAEYPFGQRVGF